jgi:hypothetical protein
MLSIINVLYSICYKYILIEFDRVETSQGQ